MSSSALLRAGLVLILLSQCLMAAVAYGGTYLGTVTCDTTNGCVVGHPWSQPLNNVNPQSIVHPVSFQQAGGAFEVRVCTLSADLEEVVAWAIQVWNDLLPRTENCFNCNTVEEGDASDLALPYALSTVILHELGHCALALDHPNRIWYPDGSGSLATTSYTMSWGDGAPNGIDDGDDNIKGSSDDTHTTPFGQLAESVSWFRRLDNDPVVVDTELIDTNTYSRSVASGLPLGSTWAANANRAVAASLGHPTTQTVMYSAVSRLRLHNGLAADEVNMVEMARTGVDLNALTADDYSMEIHAVQCSDPHDIEVSWQALGIGAELGRCELQVDYAFTQNPALARVFKLIPAGSPLMLRIFLNSDKNFAALIPCFADGFETGSLAAWSLSGP